MWQCLPLAPNRHEATSVNVRNFLDPPLDQETIVDQKTIVEPLASGNRPVDQETIVEPLASGNRPLGSFYAHRYQKKEVPSVIAITKTTSGPCQMCGVA